MVREELERPPKRTEDPYFKLFEKLQNL